MLSSCDACIVFLSLAGEGPREVRQATIEALMAIDPAVLTAAAQARALKACAAFGVILAIVGVGAWWAAIRVDTRDAIEIENEMYDEARRAHWVPDAPHKRRDQPLIEPLSLGSERTE